jgi:hypothetical protein
MAEDKRILAQFRLLRMAISAHSLLNMAAAGRISTTNEIRKLVVEE